MHNDTRVEGCWIEAFVKAFRLCGVKKGEVVAILSETQSRQINVHLAELALIRLEAELFHVVMPTLAQTGSIPVRSTGASQVLNKNPAAIAGLANASLIVDLTIEGVLNASERPLILEKGARHYFISNEHPDILERCLPTADLKPAIDAAYKQLAAAKQMRVTSEAGSDLTVNLKGCNPLVSYGYTDDPGRGDHWPGGLVACFPAVGSTNGKLVLDTGDMNLTFKRYNEAPVTLIIEDDYVVDILGEGTDAIMLREYMAAWGDKEAYGTSHVGWGLNTGARWDGATYYDRKDINGTEQRAFAGNFLYSTGSNYGANRFTVCHFDWPLRNCTITLDDTEVVRAGKLVGDLH